MAIKTVTFHQRSTGKTGQVLASPQVEAKLAKVEALFAEYHGVKMGRYKFYDLALEAARHAKQDCGGYLQYTTEAAAGIFLDHMHKELGAAVRRKSRDEVVSIKIGGFTVSNLRELARNKQGRKAIRKVA